MKDSSSDQQARDLACQRAWSSLAKDDPQGAAEALEPLATETGTEEPVAEVWAAMLAWLDDLDHLEREVRRLAKTWAESPTVVAQLAISIQRAWGRQRGGLEPASREGLVGLGVDLIDFCLERSPPSKPTDRASLYLKRAQLLFFAGPLGDERALSDYEIALSLEPERSEAWFMLARLHLLRGRWEKAIIATEQAQRFGLDEMRVGWNLSIALTGLFSATPPQQRAPGLPLLSESWKLAGHQSFIEAGVTDASGRFVAPGIDRQWVCLTSYMGRIGGGWDLTQEWKSEIVLVQALSPCHGRILHPTHAILPADFDDLVIWDPQPIDFISRGEGEEAPVFRAIAILERGDAISRPLRSERLDADRLTQLNESLPSGVFYHQAPEEVCGDELPGKLCWPRGSVAQDMIESYKISRQALD